MVARTFHDAELTEQDVLDILLPLLPKGQLGVSPVLSRCS